MNVEACPPNNAMGSDTLRSPLRAPRGARIADVRRLRLARAYLVTKAYLNRLLYAYVRH